MEFTEEQWVGLKEHADERGLLFLSSPFSAQAVELLSRVGVAAWKVASGEVCNAPMLRLMSDTRLPILLSSGMSSLEELDSAVTQIESLRLPVAVMQCTSSYPCPPEKIGLNMITLLRERYGCPIGLSDHSGTIYPGLAAATIGIEVLEVHVALSREMFGPDVPVSLTPSELRQLIEGVRFIERMNANPVDKDRAAQDLSPLRSLFTKSVVAAADLPAGTVLREEDLAVKKPGTGIPAARLSEFIGMRVNRNLKADEQLSETDLKGIMKCVEKPA
jgi:N-acetylneuraminate synthase